MITRTAPTWQIENWQKALARAIRDPAELLRRLELPDTLLPGAQRAADLFPLRVTESFLSRMEKGNPADPLLRQVLPLHTETEASPGFGIDPVGDLAATALPGLLHKYQGRVLLMTTGACAIHCRYCFRRHYPYGEGCAGQSELAAVLAHIAADSTISEVILSGGDPLSLTNNRLLDLLSRLDRIPHIQRLRIHTRLPVVLPERIDDNLLNGLADPADRLVVVLHINHANEIDPTVAAKLGELRRLGITLLNQAVLLSGINDDLTALKTLSERLFSVGVLPYYLHQLDRVQGAHHFHVEKDAAMALMAALRRELPGYLLPRLVEEISGADAKRPLFY